MTQLPLSLYMERPTTLKGVVREIIYYNPRFRLNTAYDETELWSMVCEQTGRAEKVSSVSRYARMERSK
jgi:hypothetical protein